MIAPRANNLAVAILASLVWLAGCAAPPLVSRSTKTLSDSPPDTIPPVVPSDTITVDTVNDEATLPAEELDFAIAQDDDLLRSMTIDSISSAPFDSTVASLPPPQALVDSLAVPSATIGFAAAPMVRILITEKTRRAVLYFLDSVMVCGPNGKPRNIRCQGRITAELSGRSDAVLIQTTLRGKGTVVLPCTLKACTKPSYFEYEECSYRGSVILSAGSRDGFSVVNYLDVEEYLRGVVPLEIGKRPLSDVEAVKAQAVAARTYTLRRVLLRTDSNYDLLPTVSDQVYGGLPVEDPLCDLAIRQTRGEVLRYGGSLIDAYYHSTCGGATARVEDVWNKSPVPYLRGIRDTDSRGKPYCALSRHCNWEDAWTPAQLSAILKRYGKEAFPSEPAFGGTVTGVQVKGRFACGRVSHCRIETTTGTFIYGGDRIRFAMRRQAEGFPILRSAWFEVESSNRNEIRIKGHGNGHGVGMCQMGAIGRSLQGQKYQQILKAYYPGSELGNAE